MHIDRLAPDVRAQPVTLNIDLEATEQHLARRHFEYQRVQPIDKKQFRITVLGAHIHPLTGIDRVYIRHDGGQRQRCLRESFAPARADASHANVCIVVKMFPASAARSLCIAWQPNPPSLSCVVQNSPQLTILCWKRDFPLTQINSGSSFVANNKILKIKS
jgi:hypothetical protein